MKSSYPLSSIRVANMFIYLGQQEGKFFNVQALLKLVVIANEWCLGFFNKPLIKDKIEAWKYGPIIPDLYSKFKHYGNNNVYFYENLPNCDKEQETVIKFVYSKYKEFDSIKLSMMTYAKETPWYEIFHNQNGWGKVIPNELYRQYYKPKAEKLLKHIQNKGNLNDTIY